MLHAEVVVSGQGGKGCEVEVFLEGFQPHAGAETAFVVAWEVGQLVFFILLLSLCIFYAARFQLVF